MCPFLPGILVSILSPLAFQICFSSTISFYDYFTASCNKKNEEKVQDAAVPSLLCPFYQTYQFNLPE